jgi:hypothetical protein
VIWKSKTFCFLLPLILRPCVSVVVEMLSLSVSIRIYAFYKNRKITYISKDPVVI